MNKTNSSLPDEQEGRLLLQSDNLLMEAIIIQDQEPDKVSFESISSELELMEIKEALKLYGIDQKNFYGKMCAGEFPDHLFLINKTVLFELLQNKGKQFFEEPGA